MKTKYFELVNEGAEGYSETVNKDSRTIEEKIYWLKSDLADAIVDGLNYKAKKIQDELNVFCNQGAAK